MLGGGTKKFHERLRRELKSGVNALLILHTLATHEQPVYGYEIIHTLKQASHNHVDLGPGTIYPLLKRLEKNQLVESFWGRPTTDPDGIPRKYYTLTSQGQALHQQVLQDWKDITQNTQQTLTKLENHT